MGNQCNNINLHNNKHMSKTTEYLIPPTMHLTPRHVDAMHLIKLFVKEYESARWDSSVHADDARAISNYKLVSRMSNVYDTCKNFGF